MPPQALSQTQNQPSLDTSILPRSPTFGSNAVLTAYQLVTRAEDHAVQLHRKIPANAKQAKAIAASNVLAARVMGYLFIEMHRPRRSLGDVPITRLMTEVLSNSSHDAIYDMGKFYLNHFIRAFRTTNNTYPEPSNHPSRPSIDNLMDILMDTLEGSGKDHRSARANALIRDGYKCMLTGLYDETSCTKHPAVRELADQVEASTGLIVTAHIFNEAVLQNIDPNDNFPHDAQRHHASAALSILKMFGLVDLADRLATIGNPASATGVHALVNILSLNSLFHTHFDALKLFLEPIEDGEDDEYDVYIAYPRIARDGPSRIKFVSLPRQKGVDPDGTKYPLPDPRLLALHAVCARVAHMSGAAEVLDEFDRDVKEMGVLAADGSSINTLNLMLGQQDENPRHVSVKA
ncbi:hypothetical protein DFH07DRAFT_821852 [Mycena maculata]|uniref:HNH nuclease domain-containing protein n=1 Tax=Mycena maculata TaxID=230809 RepID=A0AAD7NCQ5_9AGAR|nr:hypothetical protein DFH07DRAFT_821852 [Mycena maculata]